MARAIGSLKIVARTSAATPFVFGYPEMADHGDLVPQI
jgi:hypothetical protein